MANNINPTDPQNLNIQFTKMNGAGNDFIMIDNRDGSVGDLHAAHVQRLCHRQRGVGADGVLILEPNRTGRADWTWRFYNNNGKTSEMCGNGARCFAAFVRRLTGCSAGVSFETIAGVVRASFSGDDVTVGLTEPKDLRLHQELIFPDDSTLTVHFLNTGVPHVVVFVGDADQAMVLEQGRSVRTHPRFAPSGTNVNFVQVLQPGVIRVRSYERNVEAETLACGTGVCAAAIIAALTHGFSPPVRVAVQGGDVLAVDFQSTDSGIRNVRLSGPAEFAFAGSICIDNNGVLSRSMVNGMH